MGWQHSGAVWSAAPVTADFLSVAQVAAQCRISGADEDVLLSGLGRAAVAHVERAANRLMPQRACLLRLPCLPSGRTAVVLPGGIVASVASITVDAVTVDLTGLEIMGDSPAQVVPGADWPVATGIGWPVRIAYVAGHAAPADAPELTAAALMVAAELFERREAQLDGTRVGENPAVAALIGALRIMPR